MRTIVSPSFPSGNRKPLPIVSPRPPEAQECGVSRLLLSTTESRMACDHVARRNVLVAATTGAEACIRGLARFGRQRGWHLVTDMMQTGAFPRGWKGDGIVALVAFQSDLVQHIQGVGVPCVAIPVGDDHLPFPSVRGDNAAVGRMAAEYFLKRAYRNFAWAPFMNDQVNRERLIAFEARLAEEGCLCHTLPLAHRRIGGYWHDDWADYRRALLTKLPLIPRPAAVFAANDSVAAEILEACREQGIAVPDEIAVLGVGNCECVCESASVPLSSVELDVEEMAFRAAGGLDEMMRGNSVPEVMVVPPKRVITRLSTDMCAVANSHVARVLSYIAEHYAEPTLSVADVASTVGISRRHLERSVRTETGCTVLEHIIKRRMQEASRLLRAHPRARVGDVAELVGIDGAVTFFRTFRRFFGESPGSHRQSASRASGLAVEGNGSNRRTT